MCSHSWIRINDVNVCARCGVTRTYDGKILFDRNLPGYKKKVKRNDRNRKQRGKRAIS